MYVTLLSLTLHIDICSISVLQIFLCYSFLCIMASTVFQLCKLYFALLISAYLHLQYFFSVYFSLLSFSLHFDICSIEVLDFTIHICSTSVLCFVMWFPRLYILTSAVFQFYIIYFPLFVSTY